MYIRRWLFVVVLGLNCFGASANSSDTALLKNSVAQLNKALVAQDIRSLDVLLHPNAQYIHSNGWKESKRDVKHNLIGGVIRYESIVHAVENVAVAGKIGIVRAKGIYRVTWSGSTVNYNLGVIQVWKKHKRKWRLLSRQSEGIPDR